MVEQRPLWAHQKLAIQRATAPGVYNYALFLDLGTGKTRTMLEILRHHYNREKKVVKTVIVAPLIALSNWKNEFSKFTKIPPEKIHILEGSIKSKADQLRDLDGVILCNYDIFVKQEFSEAIIKWEPSILVLDESHRVKDGSAKRTKNIIKVSLSMGNKKYRYLMTGSPVTNSQMDIWSQFYILDHGETFGSSFFGFRACYFINKNSFMTGAKKFPNWQPKAGVDAEINRRIKSKASIVKKEECLDLPELVRVEVEVPLSPMQRKLYEEMKKDYITFVNDKAAVASIALTKLIRMMQILTGFLKVDDGTIQRFDNPRSRILAELLSDVGKSSRTIVWCVQHEDYATVRKVCKDAGIRAVEAHGLIEQKQRDINLELFRKDPEVRVLIGSPSAIGIAINLVESDLSIWYSRNFSLEQDEQASGRNHRSGSEIHSKVTRIDLVARGTLDEVILSALKDKKNMASNILQMDISKL